MARVPRRVKHDHAVRTDEVDPEAARPAKQHQFRAQTHVLVRNRMPTLRLYISTGRSYLHGDDLMTVLRDHHTDENTYSKYRYTIIQSVAMHNYTKRRCAMKYNHNIQAHNWHQLGKFVTILNATSQQVHFSNRNIYKLNINRYYAACTIISKSTTEIFDNSHLVERRKTWIALLSGSLNWLISFSRSIADVLPSSPEGTRRSNDNIKYILCMWQVNQLKNFIFGNAFIMTAKDRCKGDLENHTYSP